MTALLSVAPPRPLRLLTLAVLSAATPTTDRPPGRRRLDWERGCDCRGDRAEVVTEPRSTLCMLPGRRGALCLAGMRGSTVTMAGPMLLASMWPLDLGVVEPLARAAVGGCTRMPIVDA